MFGHQRCQVKILVLKSMGVFVGKRGLFVGPELAAIGDHVHDLVVLVVDANHLLLEHVEQNLHDAFVRLHQP